MKIFAIGDLHLSTNVEKPMNIFGPGWENHFERICADWAEKVSEDDLVLIPGDISWGMYLEEAQADLDLIANLKSSMEENEYLSTHGTSPVFRLLVNDSLGTQVVVVLTVSTASTVSWGASVILLHDENIATTSKTLNKTIKLFFIKRYLIFL